MRPYRTVFNRPVVEFVADADEETFAEIERWVNRIERTPATRGDYAEQDEDRRELQVMVLTRVAITFWCDDAVREIRVVRIDRNPGR